MVKARTTAVCGSGIQAAAAAARMEDVRMAARSYIPEPEFSYTNFIEQADGAWVAYNLEMGLVATADDPSDLPAIMKRLALRQVTFALENDNPADIWRAAPREVFDRFKAAMHEGATEIERTKFHQPVGGWPSVTLSQISYASPPS